MATATTTFSNLTYGSLLSLSSFHCHHKHLNTHLTFTSLTHKTTKTSSAPFSSIKLTSFRTLLKSRLSLFFCTHKDYQSTDTGNSSGDTGGIGGAGAGGGGGGGSSGGGGGEDSGDAGAKNKVEALMALAEVGRSLDSIPRDLAAAIEAGRIPGSIVSTYFELEESPVLRWLLNFGGFKERLLADDLFLTKVGIECGVGIFTKV